jgi:hypothetical protein
LEPLVERASRLSDQHENFRLQDDLLNTLQQRARAVAARGSAEADWAVVRAIEELRSELRIGPRLLCREAPAAFRAVRKFVPAEIVEALDAKVDERYVKQSCHAVMKAYQELCEYVGQPLADFSHTLAKLSDPPVDDAKIDALKVRVTEMENRQQEIDAAEQKRSEKEQAEARRSAELEEQSTTINDFAKRLAAATDIDAKKARTEINVRVKRDSPERALTPEEKQKINNAMRRFREERKKIEASKS